MGVHIASPTRPRYVTAGEIKIKIDFSLPDNVPDAEHFFVLFHKEILCGTGSVFIPKYFVPGI